ncbi:STING domain-containing protein [uncultured Ruegeria sp.]|uniref:STING domain-containing protein n=2 Tax=uncultured Ruegeria sp. TaxID=259304 RepID=UPI0026354C40|nr:STING domain-containing protein [uncultured Ruegeria sp.]
MRQELRVFVLGRMDPRGIYDSENTQFVHRNNTTQIARIVEGASKNLVDLGHLDNANDIVPVTPDEAVRGDIVAAVLNGIESSDVVVVDVSDESASVIYELGAVNALGIPYILVTSGDTLPFYLLQQRAILNFNFKDDFDKEDAAHLELRNRLLANYNSPDGIEFSESSFSQYFSGLPIVNISGPASIALGYFMNCVTRFSDPSTGFLSKRVKIARDRADGETEINKTRLKAYVVIVPDIIAHRDFKNARMDLEDELEKVGLNLMSASILELDTEAAAQKLGFGALIVQEFPSIVVDIPRTVYALANVPRVKIAKDNELKFKVPSGRRRLLRRLIREFVAILEWKIQTEANGRDGPWDKIHFVQQSKAPQFLKALTEDNAE